MNDLLYGADGFDRIADTNLHTGKWYAVKAIGGDVTFATGCTVAAGDAPASGDVLAQGDVLFAPFRKIALTSGTIYAQRG